MKKLFLAAAVLSVAVFPVSAVEWDPALLDTAGSANYLSEIEKDIILELNMVRSDPAGYAEEYIAPRKDSFHGRIYRVEGRTDLITSEGRAAVLECVQALGKSAAAGPLLPSEVLALAASDHADDQGETGRTGHRGSDGSTSKDRIERYGEWDITIGENIAYGPDSAREIVVQLLIDDGVRSRGHRKNIMAADFEYAGVAFGPHAAYGYVCVMDFAGSISGPAAKQ